MRVASGEFRIHSTDGFLASPLKGDTCLAPMARAHLKPGASPQEKSLVSKKQALKARINCVAFASIPNIAFIEIDTVLAQQLAVFLLKREPKYIRRAESRTLPLGGRRPPLQLSRLSCSGAL